MLSFLDSECCCFFTFQKRRLAKDERIHVRLERIINHHQQNIIFGYISYEDTFLFPRQYQIIIREETEQNAFTSEQKKEEGFSFLKNVQF